MKNFVSLVAAGLFKVLIVESLNHGIFVGLSERKVFVILVESCSSESLVVYVHTVLCADDRLTAAIESGVHNTALAFLIAGSLLHSAQMIKPILLYALFSFWTALIFCYAAAWIRSRERNEI